MITKTNKNPNQKAFTLIELLVVISIIGLLSSVVMASVSSARAKGSVAAGQKFANHTHSAFFDDLVLAWDFDSAVGTVVKDMSGNGNDLTMSGSWLQSTPKLFNNGQVISLSDSKLSSMNTMNNRPTTGNFSVSFWVNLTDGRTANLIDYSYSALSPGTWRIWISSSAVLTFITRGASAVTAGILTPSQWHQIVAVCTGTKIGIYVNGKFASNTSLGADCNFSASKLYLSSNTSPGGQLTQQPFWLDNVRIYKQALPLSFIQEQYLAELPEFKSLAKNVRQEKKN